MRVVTRPATFTLVFIISLISQDQEKEKQRRKEKDASGTRD